MVYVYVECWQPTYSFDNTSMFSLRHWVAAAYTGRSGPFFGTRARKRYYLFPFFVNGSVSGTLMIICVK